MIVRLLARAFGVVAVAYLVLAGPVCAQEQPQPSAAAVALATQILELKGGLTAFDPAIDGVMVQLKGALTRMNPSATRAIDEVERSMRAGMGAKKLELHNLVARAYAGEFTEQELKDILAFYKTTLGKKLIEREPKAVDSAAKLAEDVVHKYFEDASGKMRAELRKKGFTEF